MPINKRQMPKRPQRPRQQGPVLQNRQGQRLPARPAQQRPTSRGFFGQTPSRPQATARRPGIIPFPRQDQRLAQRQVRPQTRARSPSLLEGIANMLNPPKRRRARANQPRQVIPQEELLRRQAKAQAPFMAERQDQRRSRPRTNPLRENLELRVEELLKLAEESNKNAERNNRGYSNSPAFAFRQELLEKIQNGEIGSFVELREEIMHMATKNGVQITPANQQEIVERFMLQSFPRQELLKLEEVFKERNKLHKRTAKQDIDRDLVRARQQEQRRQQEMQEQMQQRKAS